MRCRSLAVALLPFALACGEDGPAGAGAPCQEDLDCADGLACSPLSSTCVGPDADLEPPEIFNAVITPAIATTSTVVTAVFRVSEALSTDPSVFANDGVSNFSLTFANLVDRDYTYTYTAVGTEQEKVVGIFASLTDVAGNTADNVAVGAVTFDFTPPVISGVVVTGNPYVKQGADGSVSFTVNELTGIDPVVTLTGVGQMAKAPSPNQVFVYDYTAAGTETEGLTRVSITFDDAAGNQAMAGPFDAFTFDFTLPAVMGAPVVETPMVMAGGIAAVTFEVDETLGGTPAVELSPSAGAALPMAIDNMGSTGNTYRFTRTIAGMDPTGMYDVMLSTFVDRADNAGVPVSLGTITIN